jgi:hypothetical protein
MPTSVVPVGHDAAGVPAVGVGVGVVAGGVGVGVPGTTMTPSPGDAGQREGGGTGQQDEAEALEAGHRNSRVDSWISWFDPGFPPADPNSAVRRAS